LLGRANGNPIKAVYIYSRPEWTALVTTEKSPITQVTDLKGKKIAVTRGTDPHIFLLRALALNGLTERDVKIVPLQHPEAGWRCRAATSMRGPASTRSWRRPSSKKMRGCFSAIRRSTPTGF
jgi:ABC-type nitrate/sulfonate/bicarbonate transport system substrate-binding protein